MNKLRNSQYLVNFMIGFGSILNIAPIVFLPTKAGTPSDDTANLKKDWQAVGGYLYTAMEKLDNERIKPNRNGKR